METTVDLSRWRERPRGIVYRIWTIAQNGVRQEFRTRLLRWMLFTAWTLGLGIAAICLLFNQSFSSGGWVEGLTNTFGVKFQALLTVSKGLIVLYPDICIGGFFTLVFKAHSILSLNFSLIALTAMVPRLLTRDRASNALTLYLSRPLTSTDYLLGKIGTIASVLALLWTGPLCVGWLVSMAFAPDRDFIVYSIPPLLKALAFNAIALVSLSCIVLGVSASGRSSRNTILMWIGLWLVMGRIATASGTPTWLRMASFSNDLNQIRHGIFRSDSVFKAVADFPLMNKDIANSLSLIHI
jgi:ABC-2 type transport system permease protein